eukprot:Pgem_evm1s20139
MASRGIDIPYLTNVVNLDIPETINSYLHRSGRVGRLNYVDDFNEVRYRNGRVFSIVRNKQDLDKLLEYEAEGVEMERI